MDAERAQFLFGADDPGFDVDDEDALNAFFAAGLRSNGDDDRADEDDEDEDDDEDDSGLEPRALIRTVLARQILSDEPAEVWQTVQRLREAGHERDQILNQLALVLAHEIQLALADETATEDDSGVRYRSMLEGLPAPPSSDVVAAIEAVVSGEQGVPLAQAFDEVLERLDRAGDEVATIVVDAVIDQGFELGGLGILPGDRLVFPKALTDGIVLTHRLNESEVELEVLSWVGSDLAGFAWRDDLSCGAGDDDDGIDVFSVEFGHVGWHGPDGWLREYAAGDLLAVRIDHDGVVHLERLDADPALDDDLVARLRRVYEVDISEVEQPSLCTDLVYTLLVDDPTTFNRPRLPLQELCEQAGLEVRGAFVAHDEALWREQARSQRVSRVLAAYDDAELASAVLDALEVADDLDATAEELTATLHDLEDPEVCWGMLDELVDPDGAEPDHVAAAAAFAQRLVGAARRPTERMLAHWVSAIVAERAGEVQEADAQLHIAMEADPEWGPLVDRAAWYASDRGDARRAASLWRTLERPDGEELRIVEACARVAPARSAAATIRAGADRVASSRSVTAARSNRSRCPTACSGLRRRRSATSCATAATRPSISRSSPRRVPSTPTTETASDR